ncbi:MAG TPA: hypothetical protein VH277_15085 [Gemmatimonadaceae bacterium]|nr:hypothetical protein [Gemmatimonadaceae bacterium]
MKIAVQVQPANGSPQEVEYRWDPDTEILSAQLLPPAKGEGMSGSVGLEGNDGSWLILDVDSGRINGVEIAVWPDVRESPSLRPPAKVEDAGVVVPSRSSQPEIASLESTTQLVAEADAAQRNFHFRVGKPRETRTIRIARDLLLDLDEKSQISGVWLLNVPPAPASLTD